MDIKIKILNFENYKGRNDVKHNSWFRCSNRFLEDPDFFDFSDNEKLVWIYLLAVSSQKNTADITVHHRHAEMVARIPLPSLNSAIKKLKDLGMIEIHQARSVRGRYANVTDTCSTLHNITEHNKTEQYITPQLKLSDTDFQIFWDAYPRKVGKSLSNTRYQKEIKRGEKATDILSAVEKYRNFCSIEKKEPKYILHPSTFLNHWKDWLEPDAGASINFNKKETPEEYVLRLHKESLAKNDFE